jgi:tetratricopeptide (TPR) repeat protein
MASFRLMSSNSYVPVVLLASLCGACAGQARTPTTPERVVEMEALRIVAKQGEEGSYSFEAYDAEELFTKANEALDANRCDEAVKLYDQLVQEFFSSRYASASLYNAGLCLAQTGQKEPALARFERLIAELPDSADLKHAIFQAGHLNVDLQHWAVAIVRADSLLGRSDLEPDERVEAMAMRAQALLGDKKIEEAEQQADQALTFHRTRANDLSDPYYVGAANFVLAEAIRLRAEAMTFPNTTQEEQRAILVKRAQLLLEAQRAYFDTIRTTNAHWAAASGNRIGAMYDTLWHDIMGAPVPESLSPAAKAVYPQELAKLIKPLLRHAVRYWELTLMMVERTGVKSDWAEATKRDLERTRALLLDQPPGPGGLPPAPEVTPKAPQSAPTP